MRNLKWRVVFSSGLVELIGNREDLHRKLYRDGYRMGLPEAIAQDKRKPERTFFIRPLWSGRTEKLIGVILEYVDDDSTIN